MKLRPLNSARNQTGAVMVVSLVLLLIMTVLALGASQSTRMQERMAGNARDHELALQSSEAGLRSGERLIRGLSAAPVACSTGRCQVYELGIPEAASATSLVYRDNAWWDLRAWNYAATPLIVGSGTGAEIGMAKQDPQYLIEELEEVPDALTIPPTGPPPSKMHYRITSRGVGGTDNSVVVIQSTWARRF